MSDFDQLKEILEREEGRIPYAYQDHLGFWTIGVGHCIDNRKSGRLPEHMIDMLLEHDIHRVTEDLDRHASWWRRQPHEIRIALVLMAFQLGVFGMLGFTKMHAALAKGDRAAAAREALDSRWARQTPERAARVAAMIVGRDS